MKDVLVGTDFSGLGSFEEAIKRLKINHTVKFACDKDKYVKQSYLANHNPEIFYDDIVLRNQHETPKTGIYVFGFPCQAFSIAGNRKGFEDTRGTLVYNSAEYIKIHRPEVFVAENVKGIFSHDKVKGSKSKYGRTFGVIRDLFGATVNGQENLYKYDDCLNYHIYFQILNSKDYGIPQNRERVFIVGFANREDAIKFKYPKKQQLNLSVKDIIEKGEVDKKYYLSDTAINRLIRRENFVPQINPEISGTVNTKNNSGQLSFDNGTTLIITNDEGELISKDILVSKEVRSEKAKAIRRENLKKGIDYNPQREKDIIFEKKDFVNTITTGQTKDNLIAILEATKSGYSFAGEFDTINFSVPGSKTRRGRIGKQVAQTLDTACNQAVLIPLFGTEKNPQGMRIYSENGISVTMQSQSGGMGAKTGLYLIGYKIRRLTPREVFRLFGYSDEFFEICQALNSDTQLYKSGGNSIVVDTIMWLLVEICQALKIPFTMPEKR